MVWCGCMEGWWCAGWLCREVVQWCDVWWAWRNGGVEEWCGDGAVWWCREVVWKGGVDGWTGEFVMRW